MSMHKTVGCELIGCPQCRAKRENQIEKAAEQHGMEYFKRNDLPGPGSTHDQIFTAGALWSDQNPTTESQWAKTYVALCEQGALLEKKLAVAVRALKNIQAHQPGNDQREYWKNLSHEDLMDGLAWDGTLAEKALDEIEKVKL